MADAILSGGTASGGGTSGSSGAGLPPSNCKNLEITKSGTTVQLSWVDPGDTIVDGQILCSQKGTKIVRKVGSFPTSPTDGTLIVDSTIKNAYAETPYNDIVENEETEYYYRAFPYSANGVYNLDERNNFGAVIYGFWIDKLDPNPETRVHYIEENENFNPGRMNYTSGAFELNEWKDAFFVKKNRPVMLKNDGSVDYELHPTNLALRADGETSDITNTAYEGNAMSGIPLCWLKIINEATKITVRVSNKQVDSSYKAYAHTNKDGDIIPEIFLPIYEGSIISNVMRSLSGQRPSSSTTSATERTAAVANGDYWFTRDLSSEMLIRILLILISKTTDSQKAFGNGHYSGGTQASHLHTTGAGNEKGQFWGSTGNEVVVLFYMQNWYGDRWDRIAGWINDNGTQKIKLTYGTQDGSTTTGYNETGAGYIAIGAAPSGTSGGYISKCVGNEYGIFPQVASGSSSTFECDGFWYNNGQINYALVGGSCADGLLVGAFASGLNYAPSGSDWHFGASLSCKPPLQ